MELSLEPIEASYVSPLFLKLGSFEGPIDLLLELCRQHKVDLKEISILDLADQYISFIQTAQQINLELAADYLVMAAWLTYLKSRLLLPQEEFREEEPSAKEMAEWLQFQLQRLQAIRDQSEILMARQQLGQDFYRRGYDIDPREQDDQEPTTYDVGLYDVLKAYGDMFGRKQSQHLVIEETDYLSMEDAVDRLKGWIGKIPEWCDLKEFLPEGVTKPDIIRSAVASTFAACLELTKQRALSLRQLQPFGPIYIRSDHAPREGSE